MAERPEDLNLPNSVIARIIKEGLPDGVNVSKDARLAISKAASVFVLYATSCANNFAMNHKRKTIAPQDVIEAMKEMEFDRFVDTLKESLEAYKDEQKQRKATAQQKKKDKEDNENASPEKAEGQKEGEDEEVVSEEEGNNIEEEGNNIEEGGNNIEEGGDGDDDKEN